MMPKVVLSIAASVAMAVVSFAADSSACQWAGDGLKAWLNFRQAKEGSVETGVLGYTVDGGDASVRVDGLALKTSPLQKFRFRVRSGASGKAEIFWHLKGEPDFKQRFSTSVNIIGDGTWRTYEVSPFWQPGQPVLAIRFGAPRATASRFPRSRSSWAKAVGRSTSMRRRRRAFASASSRTRSFAATRSGGRAIGGRDSATAISARRRTGVRTTTGSTFRAASTADGAARRTTTATGRGASPGLPR